MEGLKIKEKANKSELKQVIKLQDNNTSYLGFLSKKVFEIKNDNNSLLIAKLNNEVCGYLLYHRLKVKPQIRITQTLVKDGYRKKGIAKALVNYLVNNHSSVDVFRLKCRVDLEANSFWEKLNFNVGEEVPSKNKGKANQIVYYLDKREPEENIFFEYFKEYDNRIHVYIDTNILINSFNNQIHRDDIFNTDLPIKIIYCISKFHYEDIAESKDLNLIEYMKYNTTQIDQKLDDRILSDLKEFFKEKDLTRSFLIDLKHLSLAIKDNRIDMFLTEDYNDILSKRLIIEEKFGLKIFSKDLFISYIYQEFLEYDFLPSKIYNTKLNSKQVSVDEIVNVVDKYYTSNLIMKKYQFKNKVEKSMKDQTLFLLGDNKSNIILFNKYISDNEISSDIISFNREIKSKNERDEAFKIIISLLINESLNKKINKLKIKVYNNQLKDYGVFSHLRFYNKNEMFIKNFKYDIVQGRKDNLNYNNELLFWPRKYKNLKINNYIIPIKKEYANRLFMSDNSDQSLFDFDYKILLSFDNVYYHNSKTRIKFPARILWYISNDNTSSKFIKYSSYLTKTESDYPKVLFRKYSKKGVFSLKDLYNISRKERKINCFVFNHTEVFTNLVPLHYVKKRYKQYNKKGLILQSIVEISSDCFFDIYERGNNV